MRSVQWKHNSISMRWCCKICRHQKPSCFTKLTRNPVIFYSFNKMPFRVIISTQNIQKVRLDPVPDSVDGLKLEPKSRLQLKDPFDLEYEDEDFHDFCNLTCVADLSKDKISKEFTRLVSKDLSKSFFEGLDGHLSKLMQLFRSKCYEDIPEMTSILESLNKDTTN